MAFNQLCKSFFATFIGLVSAVSCVHEEAANEAQTLEPVRTKYSIEGRWQSPCFSNSDQWLKSVVWIRGKTLSFGHVFFNSSECKYSIGEFLLNTDFSEVKHFHDRGIIKSIVAKSNTVLFHRQIDIDIHNENKICNRSWEIGKPATLTESCEPRYPKIEKTLDKATFQFEGDRVAFSPFGEPGQLYSRCHCTDGQGKKK